jgi:hypothetical protein
MSNTNFWKTDNGKILNHVIHEHNSGLGIIVNYNYLLEGLLKDKLITFADSDAEGRFIKAIKGIDKGKVRCREAVDYCYTKFKEKEDDKNKST